MERHSGGAKVSGGYYWNVRRWGLEAVLGDEGVLPGTSEEQFLRVPVLLAIPAVLAMSFLFVLFLPAVGFALFAWVVAQKSAATVQAGLRSVSMAFASTWQPGAAYFTDKSADENAPPAPTPALNDLQREIDVQRDLEDKK